MFSNPVTGRFNKKGTLVSRSFDIHRSDVCHAHELCYETAQSCAVNGHYVGLKTNCMLESVHVLHVFQRESNINERVYRQIRHADRHRQGLVKILLNFCCVLACEASPKFSCDDSRQNVCLLCKYKSQTNAIIVNKGFGNITEN